MVGIVVIAFLVLAGLPFGGKRRDGTPQRPRAVETVNEAPPPPQSATIVEVPSNLDETKAAKTKRPQPSVVAPATVARQVPAAKAPSPAPVLASRVERSEISGAEAEAALREYVMSTNYYRLAANCVRVDNRGYQNVGYTLEMRDGCGGGSRMLGRWRVDAKTREIFRQREDGRYLRP